MIIAQPTIATQAGAVQFTAQVIETFGGADNAAFSSDWVPVLYLVNYTSASSANYSVNCFLATAAGVAANLQIPLRNDTAINSFKIHCGPESGLIVPRQVNGTPYVLVLTTVAKAVDATITVVWGWEFG
jgi:hypothetical protein